MSRNGLLAFDRDARQRRAHVGVATDQQADLEADGHRVIGARDLDLIAGRIDQLDLRTHDDLGRTTAFRIDHDQGGKPGDLVHWQRLVEPSSTFSNFALPAIP